MPEDRISKRQAPLLNYKFSDQLATDFWVSWSAAGCERRDEENRGWATFQGHARQRSTTPSLCAWWEKMGREREKNALPLRCNCMFFVSFPCVRWFILFCCERVSKSLVLHQEKTFKYLNIALGAGETNFNTLKLLLCVFSLWFSHLYIK